MHSSEKQRSKDIDYVNAYTGNVFRLVLIAAILISLSVIITGAASYISTENALLSKSKSQDMIFIVKSMSERIEGRMQRAMETSYMIARDPFNIEWLNGAEKDSKLGELVLERLNAIATSYDYSSTFICGVKSKHYYFRKNEPQSAEASATYILSESNPSDEWFFDSIASKNPMSLNVDFDRGMNDSFLFVNTLIGNIDSPSGIGGVGLSLKDISAEFQQFKVGTQSNLWMVDEKGIIQLSDELASRGKEFSEFVPQEVLNHVNLASMNTKNDTFVSQYTNSNGKIMDYAFHKLASSNWILFYQITRSENISIIDSLKLNTIITIILILLFFVAIFYIISRKVANPYKQALLLNTELENKVNERTSQLMELNTKIMDSIDYAKRMQESILPSQEELKNAFDAHFVIWRPRDIVGGDFYWLREVDDTVALAVGDCTGHGVPGALMTMTVNAILHHIVATVNKDDPRIIIQELDKLLKQALNKASNAAASDDGLDIAICCIKNKAQITYAGAGMSLYVKRGQELTVCKAFKNGAGYNNTILNDDFINVNLPIEAGDVFILTSDGFIHQNGGDKDYPFGTKRFCEMIHNDSSSSLDNMKAKFEETLEEYMNEEPQRDDIVLMAFKVK